MKPVRIAQIGSGHDHAPAAFKTLLNLKEHFDLIGFAESTPGREVPELYNEVPRYTVEELLAMPDLEAVAIECEELNATAVAQKFADKGVAIYLDKPGSPNAAAFDHLMETIEQKHLPFQMGYMYRYNPSVQKLMGMAKRGELGDIYSVEAHMSVRHLNEKREWLGQFKGGMTYFLGCHLIDMVLQLQGEPLEVIPLNCSTHIEDVHTEDFGFVAFRYDNGVSFIKTCAAEANGFYRRQLVVCGSKGTYEIKPFEKHESGGMQSSPTTVALVKDNPEHKWHNFAQPQENVVHDRYETMMQRFAQSVRGAENAYPCSYEKMLFHTLMKCCKVGY
ncbi:MAG: Gfo/Idh/MocA family oxidoreductase [Clostridia bacterium]|nr:Gfo/Idh/MocA family oxidoreductase [Clostridia bacterium]